MTINYFTFSPSKNEDKTMTEELNLALQLLLIGMVSVFLILGIVVALGKLLVTAVNRISPEVVTTPKKRTKIATSFNPKKLAALTAVVDIVTQQQGVIKSIKKHRILNS